MAERCPLGTGLYWNNEGQIPQFCLEHCETLWREATKSLGGIDVFDQNCIEGCDIEYGDEALQRSTTADCVDDPGRWYSILNICGIHRTEMFAEEYKFRCPYN